MRFFAVVAAPLTLALSALVLAAAPGAARAQGRDRFRIGPEAGVYFPTSDKARDAFGNSWYNIGFGLGKIALPRKQGEIGYDVNVITARRSGSQALVIPLGVSYRVGLSDSTSFAPYVGATAGAYLLNLRSDKYDVSSGFRVTGGGSVFLGAALSSTAYVESRYRFIGKSKGFDVSGLAVSAGVRF